MHYCATQNLNCFYPIDVTHIPNLFIPAVFKRASSVSPSCVVNSSLPMLFEYLKLSFDLLQPWRTLGPTQTQYGWAPQLEIRIPMYSWDPSTLVVNPIRYRRPWDAKDPCDHFQSSTSPMTRMVFKTKILLKHLHHLALLDNSISKPMLVDMQTSVTKAGMYSSSK